MAVLFRRFGAHWRELVDHLRSDENVPPYRDLALQPTEDCATDVALGECKHLFDTELSGSGSLNTRGTQLAGLTGATITLVATLAENWLSATKGTTRVCLGLLIIFAMLALFLAMYCAIFAVLPTSKWRTRLASVLSDDLASNDPEPAQREELSRSMGQAYLVMAEDQRIRNQAKADDMLLAYGFLALGVIVLLVAAVIFVSVQITPSSIQTHTGTTPTGTTHTGTTPTGATNTATTPTSTTSTGTTSTGTTPTGATNTGTTPTGTTPTGATNTGTTHTGTTSMTTLPLTQ